MRPKSQSESPYDQIPEFLHQDKDDETGGRRRFLLEVDESRRMMDEVDALEAIKLTMIRQDTIFRHQVLELHRLYWMQKNTVKAFYSNGIGNDLEYIQKPFTPLPTEVGEKKSSLWHMKGGLPEEFMGYNGYTGVVCDKHHQVSRSNHNRVTIDLEADITLAIKDNNNEMSSAGRPFFRRRGYFHAENLFDLNKTIDFMSKEEDTVVYSSNLRTPPICSEIMSESQLPALSDVTSCERTSRDSVIMVPAMLSHTGQDKSKIAQSKRPSIDSESLSSSKTSRFEFDLNMVHPEESSVFEDPQALLSSISAGSSANSNGVTNESHASTYSIANLRSVLSGTCTRQTSNAHKIESMNSLGMESSNLCEAFPPSSIEDSGQGNQLSSRSHPVRNAVTPIFSKFDLNTPLQHKRIGGLPNGFGAAQQKTSGCPSKPVLIFSKNSTEDYHFYSSVTDSDLPMLPSKALTGERSKEDTSSSSTYREERLVKSDIPAPHEQHLVRDNNVSRSNSCSEECQPILERPMGRVMIADACPSQTDTLAEVCGRVNMEEKSSDTIRFVTKEQTKQNIQQAPEVDHMVLDAAKSLVNIHTNDSMKPPNSCLQVDDMELEVGKNSDQPHCSSDSFELLVLAIPECMEDDCSSLAVLPADNETTKDATCRFKTRSGRKLRDFQKDILPGLVSLSRHEICEDLHAFMEIIKSEDSNKKGFSKALRGNWGNTIRTRRSRLYPIGQRR